MHPADSLAASPLRLEALSVGRLPVAVARQLRDSHGIKALVVACNTATAAAIHEVRSSHPDLLLVGLEPAIKSALAVTKTGHVGVIGTRGTLTSAKFGKLMASLADQAHFVVQPCDGLAHAIERSVALPVAPAAHPVESTETGALCKRYVNAMGAFGTAPGEMDTLVLGCTHYIFVAHELRTLVDMLGYPVTNTLMGLGAYPASDRKFLGMLGMHGTVEANNAMQNCDVLLAVGARFDDRVIGNPKHFAQNERKIIHIDIDPSSISKRVKVDIPIVGDVKDVLTELISMVRESGSRPDEAALAAWWTTIESWRERDCLKYDRGNKEVIKPQYVVETLWNMTKDSETYITSDVGQHQMWAAQFYRFDEPRRWINSGGLGTMGVGIPYAMGIKLAKPDAEVFCITGEGSVQMNIQELSTCLQYNTPIKVVALNNRYLGMVRQWQEIEYSGRYSHSYMDALPNFVKLAEAYGHVGLLIEHPRDVEPALREARKLKDRTVFLDFRTDPTENVFPMVQAGKGLTEMLLGSEDL